MGEWRPAPWRKIWGNFVDSRKLRGIGSHARAVIATAIASQWWDEESPEGRLYRAANKPTTLVQLMADAEVPKAAQAETWKRVLEAGSLAVVDGVIVLPGCERHQRGKSTKYTREHRRRVSEQLPGVFPEAVEVEAELDEEADNNDPHASGNDLPSKRKRSPRMPRRAAGAELEAHVLAELQTACRELTGDPKAGPRKVTDGMRDSLAKLHAAEEPTAEEWTRVIRCRLAMDQRGEGYGDLSWEHLCRPASFRRYRDAVQRPTSSRRPAIVDDHELPDWMRSKPEPPRDEPA